MPALSGLVISPVVATFWKCLQSGVAFQTGLDCTTDWVDNKTFSGVNFYLKKIFMPRILIFMFYYAKERMDENSEVAVTAL